MRLLLFLCALCFFAEPTVGLPMQAITFVNTSTYTILISDAIVWVNSTIGPVDIYLPASWMVPGNTFILSDGGQHASTNNIVIHPNGQDNFLQAGPGQTWPIQADGYVLYFYSDGLGTWFGINQ